MTELIEAIACPLCDAPCVIETFTGESIQGVATLYMCSNDHVHGGGCDRPAYLTLEAWNADHPTAITDAGYRIVKDKPSAFLYEPTNRDRVYDGDRFVQLNRANMDKRYWTETPLYAAAPGYEK